MSRARCLHSLALLALALGIAACDAQEPASPSTPVEPELANAASEHAPAATARSDVAEAASSSECKGCHAAEYAAWRGSDHDRAIERPTSASVEGDFEGSAFEHFGKTTRFRRDAGKYWIETEGPDGEPHEYEVAYTFGFEPLQQYLIEMPGGRLQSLTVAWDTQRDRWFSLYPEERIAPGDPLHWTGRMQRWNTMCAECHSTALVRGYDPGSDSYAPSFAELNVGCQACHGLAGEHARSARAAAGSDTEPGTKPHAKPKRLPVPISEMSAAHEVEVCAPCHSRRALISSEVALGKPFLDHYAPELLRQGLYHPDGQVDGEVYVYGSFLQSRMYQSGVRCNDCHEPHGLGLRATGDALCLQCHSEEPNPRFPSLRARRYDSPAHHFHPVDSAGARCVECHMPSKTFMEVDARRDHSLRIPRPDLSVALGTPNACTGCHADRDAAWAARQIEARSGKPAGGEHYGQAIAAARDGRATVETLARLAASPEVPDIARATVVDAIPAASGDPRAAYAALVLAARDDSGLVRVAAVRSLERVPGPDRLALLTALLEDPLRLVRIEAGRVLAGVPLDRLSPDARNALGRALEEFRDAQRAVADTPAAHLNLGVVENSRGQPEAAVAEYRRALALAPEFIPARMNLATVLNGLGRNDEALGELEAALKTAALAVELDGGIYQRGEIHYSTGLLLAELGRLPEAERALERAASDLPERPRVRYNHGLTLQRLGQSERAEAVFLDAEAIAPESPEIQNALAILLLQRGEPEQAMPYALKLLELTRGAPESQRLVAQVEAEIARANDREGPP